MYCDAGVDDEGTSCANLVNVFHANKYIRRVLLCLPQGLPLLIPPSPRTFTRRFASSGRDTGYATGPSAPVVALWHSEFVSFSSRIRSRRGLLERPNLDADELPCFESLVQCELPVCLQEC